MKEMLGLQDSNFYHMTIDLSAIEISGDNIQDFARQICHKNIQKSSAPKNNKFIRVCQVESYSSIRERQVVCNFRVLAEKRAIHRI